MRCTDCDHAKETIPEQLRYVFCSKYGEEMPTWVEFQNCYYVEEVLAKAEGRGGR